jgi:hypothetical protein
MTRRPDLQLRKEAEKRAAEFAARFGENIPDQKRHECRRAGQLTAIADLMREQALSGTVDFDKLKQAEDMAAAAVLALGMPEYPTVTKLEIELIPSQRATLEAAELRARLEALSVRDQQQAQTDPSQSVATAPPAAPSAPPPNVVSITETREQRIARLRYEAGDRLQALRAPFDNGYGGEFELTGGATRFDNKVRLP